MDSTELEKDSAPPLIELLEQRGIETVAFDIDNTVLDTDLLFHKTLYSLGLDIPAYFPFEVPLPCYEELSRVLENETYRIYYKNKRSPRLIAEQYREALRFYLTEQNFGEVTPDMEDTILWYQQRHYSTSPEAYRSTKDILQLILDSGFKIGFNSHAQQDWTEMKISYISKLLDDFPELPFIAVPIENQKDPESWATLYEMTGTKAENVLTVGDNFNSDILSAMKAGCRTLVWINKRGGEIPKDFLLEEDVHLYIIKNIAELKDIGDEYRYIM